MNKGEFYEKAESIIQKRRLDAISENQMRIDEVNRDVPEISELNAHLYNTSYEIFKIISEGRDVDSRIAELKKSNLEIQRLVKSTLRNYNYPPDYLDIHYYCKDCNDTGYRNGEYCHCFHELVTRLFSEEINRKSPLQLSSFDTFSLDYYQNDNLTIMKKHLERAKSFVNEFNLKKENILMFGETGLGKTHLSLAIANEVLKKGYFVMYDSAVNILGKIEQEHFGRDKENDTLSLVNNADLLIIDDLGMEYNSSFYVSTVCNIVESRLNTSMPTIISTNLNLKEIKARYSNRISSRLSTMYTIMAFCGRDVRSQKKQMEKQS